jgi:hypothetical protein
MNPEIKKIMLSFYFGSVNEEERLLIERELLTDSEVLVDYLDIKRKLEAANILDSQPSQSLWHKMKPKNPVQRKVWISFSVGAAVAAGLVLFFIFQTAPDQIEMPQPSAHRVLFDSSSELPASSGVL